MRKPAFCICKKVAFPHECTAYIDSKLPLLPKSEPLAISLGHTARFVSDLIGNTKTGFLVSWLNYMQLYVNVVRNLPSWIQTQDLTV